MLFDAIRDVRLKYIRYVYFDEGSREDMVNKTLPESLERLECQFEIHPGDFIIGNKLSYTDYILFEELDIYHVLDGKILDKFPALKAFWERMWQRPNLKPYLEKRTKDNVWISAVEKGMN